MITALLVDDEPRALERLATLLEESGMVDVIGTAANVDDAERFLAGRTPDVVFLDINMPGRLGIDLVKSIRPGTRLVFVTAHEGHALDAFRHGAVDYVLKPFDRDRLGVTLGRLAPAPPVREVADRSEGSGLVRLTHDAGRTATIVPLVEVCWVEAVHNQTRVQTSGRPPGLVRRTMQDWEELVGNAGEFRRLSRSLIIRLPALESTQWQSRDQTLLFFAGVAEPLPIGRTAMSRLRELLAAR